MTISSNETHQEPESNSTSVLSPQVEHSPALLLQAYWRSPDRVHQIGTLNKSKRFNNAPVNSVDDAINRAYALSKSELDVYFAPAEYTNSASRQATNAEGAYGYWLDIDCGDEKAAQGKGYKTVADAQAALQAFCEEIGLPAPTHQVASGGGLHVYFATDTFIPRERWQEIAVKLKALTHKLGFLADDTRTADIASVLRIPGTKNHKEETPRPVKLLQATATYIVQSTFCDAIDSAHLRLCSSTPKPSKAMALPLPPAAPKSAAIHQLQSLLDVIPPDVGYETWTQVTMGTHHETGGSDAGFELANSWSAKGEKYCGIEVLRAKWKSFENYQGRPITIATLIKIARENGMDAVDACDEFTPCEMEVVEAVEHKEKPKAQAANPLAKYSLLDRSSEVEKQTVAQVPVLGKIALMGQSTMLYAAPNTGKTLITLYLIIEGIKQGRIQPSKLYYLNMDDSGTGLLTKLRLAEEFRFHMLAEGHRDFRVTDFLNLVNAMVENNQARGVILVLDTLKKFVDLMDKAKGSSFGKVIRRFVVKGGTLVALAHTNKNPGRDGKPKFSGTSDIVDDCDCAFTLAPVSNDDGRKVVEFENIKRRGDVAQTAAYGYSSGNNISYEEILMSVTFIDPDVLEPIRQAEAIKSDNEVITAVISSINDGINTKMRLADAVSAHAGISKKSALNIIEKYSGDDPSVHRWNYVVRERGAKVFVVLESAGKLS